MPQHGAVADEVEQRAGDLRQSRQQHCREQAALRHRFIERRRREQRDGGAAHRASMLGGRRHDIIPHRTTVNVLDPLKHQLFERQADERDHHDAGQHDVGVEEFARPENEPAEPPRYGREHFDPDQDAPRLGEPEPQAGENVGQRAGQDDVAEQPSIVGPHGLRGPHPDFLDGLHAGPGVEDDRKRRHEADQQHGRQVAETEPQQEQRRIGEPRDRRPDADQRQENVFGKSPPAHGDAERDAGDRGEREAARQAQDGVEGVVRKNARDGEPNEGRDHILDRRKQSLRKNSGMRQHLPDRCHHDKRESGACDDAPPAVAAHDRRLRFAAAGMD